jgi:type VI secretion system protein ImpF
MSVLDRLLEDGNEGPRARLAGASLARVRAAVRRDLENLLNSKRPWPVWPTEWSELDRSLASYGVPDYSGMVFGGERAQHDLRGQLSQIIERFEPRLQQVEIELLSKRGDISRRLRFKVKAVLRMEPYAERVTYESEVEPGARAVHVREASR